MAERFFEEMPTGPVGKEIHEPKRWKFDGDLQRKVPVFDHNFKPPRLVRYTGWRPCLKCREPHFTPDISRIRLCDRCKTTQISTSDLTEAELEKYRAKRRKQ